MPSGAYTGDVSAQMLVDTGCRWVILGIQSAASTMWNRMNWWRQSWAPPWRRDCRPLSASVKRVNSARAVKRSPW